MVDPSIRRASEILKKVAHNGEVIEYDVLNVSAAMSLDASEVSRALAADGVHTVDYETPQFQVQKLASRDVLTDIKRAASFSKFRG
jgi:hypothetical protein